MILVAWTVSFIADVVVKSYDPHPSITPLALATVGWLFGGEVMAKVRADKPKAEEVET